MQSLFLYLQKFLCFYLSKKTNLQLQHQNERFNLKAASDIKPDAATFYSLIFIFVKTGVIPVQYPPEIKHTSGY